jgi:hypothetical protein
MAELWYPKWQSQILQNMIEKPKRRSEWGRKSVVERYTDRDIEGVGDAVQRRAVPEAPKRVCQNTNPAEREREENLAVSKQVVRGDGMENVALPTPHEKQDVGISF